MSSGLPDNVFRAGRRVWRELVHAAASADLTQTGTVPEAPRAAAGRALAQISEGISNLCMFEVIDSPKELRGAIAALAELFSASLREVASLASLPAQSGGSDEQEDNSCGVTGLRQAGAQGSKSRTSECDDGGPSDWVQLLADSGAVVGHCIYWGIGSNGSMAREKLRGVLTAAAWTSTDARMRDIRSCSTAMVAALLRSDALPALSRLLSAEAQRGPSLALLSPKDLTTCLQLLEVLLCAAKTAPTVLLPAALPALDSTWAHNQGYVQNPLQRRQQQQQQQQQQPFTAAASPAATQPTSASTPPRRLGPAVWTAVGQCGVVEAACKLVAMRLGAGGQQARAGRWADGGDGSRLLHLLLEVVSDVLCGAMETDKKAAAGVEQLPPGPLQGVLAEPCVQYVLAAHAVSQLHASDGGTTYGLPYGSLLPPIRRERTEALSCVGVVTAVTCWLHLARIDELSRIRSLSPGDLIELCLRAAEAAADSWRRRDGLLSAGGEGNSTQRFGGRGRGTYAGRGLPFRAEGISQPESLGLQGLGGSAGHVGRGTEGGSDKDGSSSNSSQEASCPTTADRRLARLDPSPCACLALTAMHYSQSIMASKGSRCLAAERRREAAARSGGAGGSSDAALAAGGGDGGAGSGGGASDEGGGDGTGGGGGDVNDAALAASGGGGGVDSGGGASDEGGGDDGGRGSSSGEGRVAWLGGGGPLAWRWWRAAVAAVHCGLDQPDPRKLSCTFDYVGWLLDLGPYVAKMEPGGKQGPPLPAAPPAALPPALRAGYLPCLERALRVGVRTANTPGDLLTTWRDLFGAHEGPHRTGWDMQAAYGDGKEAAALLITAAKAVRRMMADCAQRMAAVGPIACATVGAWWCSMLSDLVGRAVDVARAEGGPAALAGMGVETLGSFCSGSGSGGGGNGGSGGGSSGSGSAGSGSGGSGSGGSGGWGGGSDSGRLAAGPSSSVWSAPGSAAAAAAAAVSRLPHSAAQQLVRLVGFGLPVWLPLCLQLLELGNAVGVDGKLWRWQVSRAADLVSYAMRSMALALERRDRTAAESWGRLLQQDCNIGAALEGWCEGLERRRPALQAGAQDWLLQGVKRLLERWRMLDSEARRRAGTERRVTADEDLEEAWLLAGLMPPPCDAGQILACCSNPRCAELAGDSEAGVVLRRCGGACGGAVAYCCTACQRAHWAAGHKGQCGRRGGGSGEPAERT